MAEPIVLIDAVDEGGVEEWGYVQATVSEGEALRLVEPLVMVPPSGVFELSVEGTKWYSPSDPNDLDGLWNECAEGDAGAVEFYRVLVSDEPAGGTT